MSDGKNEQEFKTFLDEQKSVTGKLLDRIEAIITPEEVKKIGSLKGNMLAICEHLHELMMLYGTMEDLQLSELQLEKHRHQVSQLLAKRTKLLETLSRLCVEIYNAQADRCFGAFNGEVAADKSLASAHQMHLQLLYFVTGNFHNFTDCGAEFCLALSKISFLFSEFVNPMLTHWLDKYENVEGCKVVVLSSLGFMYNMFYRNNSDIYNALSSLEVVEPVMPYLKSSDLAVQTQALVLIAFALDESKASLYENATGVMQCLVKYLNESLDAPDRRAEGYHTSELAICVNRLALNEVNKVLLVQLGLLPVLHQMCNRSRDDEVALALEILFTLSFKENNRKPIEEQFLDVLTKLFASSEQNSMTKGLLRNSSAMQGLDLNLCGKISAACPSAVRPMSGLRPLSSATGRHVMISYQHEQKKEVMHIKEALVKNNIKVWIDYERMKDGETILGMMAEAVEGSYAFIMCMSRTYKESNNCRMEAEYAHKMRSRIIPLLLERGYKPNGWLGFILGMGLYYDFSGKYAFHVKLAEVLEVLGKARLGEDDTDSVVAVAAGKTSRPPSSDTVKEHHFSSTYATLPPIPSDRLKVRQWSQEQVQQWARDLGLPQAVLAAGLSGQDLYFLMVARNRAPEAFYRMAERYLPVSTEMPDIARFVNALYEL